MLDGTSRMIDGVEEYVITFPRHYLKIRINRDSGLCSMSSDVETALNEIAQSTENILIGVPDIRRTCNQFEMLHEFLFNLAKESVDITSTPILKSVENTTKRFLLGWKV